MNSIIINCDLASVASMQNALNELTHLYFSHYPKMHARAKQNHKAQPIDLSFGYELAGRFCHHTAPEETMQWLQEVLSIIDKRRRWIPDEQTQGEIAFFAEACQHQALTPAIRNWLNRLATYNFGVYSPTMHYKDHTPVGFWAAFLLVNQYPEEMSTYINYVSSLTLPNQVNKRKTFQDQIYGLEHPSVLAANHYLYKTQGWNDRTLQLLCTQMAHYWYFFPEEWPDLCEEINLKAYLNQADHLQQFTDLYKACQTAFIKEHDYQNINRIMDEVFPEIMDQAHIDRIKPELIKAFG